MPNNPRNQTESYEVPARNMTMEMIHTATLTSGATRPIKLARERKSDRCGSRKYITHPNKRMNGEASIRAVSMEGTAKSYPFAAQA